MAKNNSTILDAVWLSGSNDYQQRVPRASQAGVDAVIDTLTDPINGRSLFNEFETGLINRIGTTIVRGFEWANPLGIFKREMLRHGSAIQEIAVDLVEANGYDIRDSNLFKTNPGKVYEAFHVLNRQDRYDISISHAELRQAFTSEYGLNELVARKLAAPRISDQYDEFRIMIQLIGVAYANDELFKVSAPIANTDAPTAEELKNLSVKIRSTAKKLALAPSGRYNAKGVPTVSRKEDLVLITTPDITANLDVNVLADAFNVDRADFASRIIEIDEFPMDGVHAMLVDRSWFVCADFVREMGVFWNAKNMVNNYYYHHWGTYSVSPFSNAVIFGDAAGSDVPVTTFTVTGIEAAATDENGDIVTEISSDSEVYLAVEGVGTISGEKTQDFLVPGAYKTAIKLEAAEGEEEITQNLRTRVDTKGRVYVQPGAPAGSTVTVTVTATYVDPSGDGKPGAAITDEVVLTVA